MAESAERTPLRLALVVDRSGSMDGAPLTEALRCVRHIGASLGARDQLAVVLYDNRVQVPLPLTLAPGAKAVAAALAEVHSGGNTALHAGWLGGAGQLEAGTPGHVSRVLLLSDGQANNGLTEPAAIAAECAQWLAKGVSTTTVGLGHHFNEELMVAMAQAGGGQHYYGQRAEDLFDAFDEELALLQALMLRQLQVKPVPAPGVIVEPLGRDVAPANAAGWLPLPDLAWGAQAWTLLRLHVPAGPATDAAGRALLAVSLQGVDGNGAGWQLHVPPLMLPVLPAAQVAALPADETVARRLQELAFADQMLRSRELLERGRQAEARALLQQAESLTGGDPWLVAKLERIRELAEQDESMSAKEMLYSSGKMRRRLVAKSEVLNAPDQTHDASVPPYLRRKASEGQGKTGPA